MQGKQKRNNRKGKDKAREAKPVVEEKRQQESRTDERKDFLSEVAEVVLENPDTIDDVSDMSDSVDCATEDRESSPINWDTDTSEVHHPPTEASSSVINSLLSVQNGGERKSPSLRDDSSSTCSTESLPSVVTNGSYKGNSLPNKKTQKSPSRYHFVYLLFTCCVLQNARDPTPQWFYHMARNHLYSNKRSTLKYFVNKKYPINKKLIEILSKVTQIKKYCLLFIIELCFLFIYYFYIFSIYI